MYTFLFRIEAEESGKLEMKWLGSFTEFSKNYQKAQKFFVRVRNIVDDGAMLGGEKKKVPICLWSNACIALWINFVFVPAKLEYGINVSVLVSPRL